LKTKRVDLFKAGWIGRLHELILDARLSAISAAWEPSPIFGFL